MATVRNTIEDIPLEEMVALAQQGDESVQNYLLQQYQPFIAKCVSEVCKRYIDPKRDDEFSIGLSAFNESIKTYSEDRGTSFLTFATLVIKRKVIDYIRYMKKGPSSVSLDETYDEEQMENPMEYSVVKDQYEREQDSWYRRQEILDFSKKLSSYKLSLKELTKVSPKHKDSRDTAVRIARMIYDDVQLREFVKEKKKLPIKELSKQVEVSKKTLERNRKFILAIFIVLDEDYVYLQDYLKGVGC
ncbi:RNA polymerase sigma-I factor [Ornithinibacillus sp. L9]|uniref:RNA polymerase sigma factor SigI n=1 Tax=Ornithinibacillus caprae TaxID=2678566 RepID=A0A6N8FN54_9BACI|nr:RNA polymerase sigma-I factor [Ornithinibacillus caprae]MUK88788.1 RNA polymerase sigma-I factor [Ornithinibacillus caprae]